jgi:glycosyltransferase involved in cell wall biosynthesis
MKIAILSHVVPPMPSGQSVVLGRLLQAFARDEVLLMVSFRGHNPGALTDRDERFSTYYLARDLPGRSSKYVLLAGMSLRAWRVASILRRERCRSIVACSGDILDLPAGYVASRLTGVPFYAYLFDDYLYQWPNRAYRLFVRCVEPFIMKRAAGVIVPNEFLRDEYNARYGVSCTVVRNPHPYPDSIPAEVRGTMAKGEIRIVFSGAVYHVNYDALRSLLAAIESMNRPEIKLHIYTAQSEEQAGREGIVGPVVFHNHLSPMEMLSIQQQADILYLPLGFNNPVPELMKTSAPGKMGEYLAAGGPILVHAPKDSFICWYFRQHDCGLVVDENETPRLVEAVESLLADEALRARLVTNARVCAGEDFGLTMAQSRFRSLVMGAGVADV